MFTDIFGFGASGQWCFCARCDLRLTASAANRSAEQGGPSSAVLTPWATCLRTSMECDLLKAVGIWSRKMNGFATPGGFVRVRCTLDAEDLNDRNCCSSAVVGGGRRAGLQYHAASNRSPEVDRRATGQDLPGSHQKLERTLPSASSPQNWLCRIPHPSVCTEGPVGHLVLWTR